MRYVALAALLLLTACSPSGCTETGAAPEKGGEVGPGVPPGDPGTPAPDADTPPRTG